MTEFLSKYNTKTKEYENTGYLLREVGDKNWFYNKTKVLQKLGLELSVLDEDLNERVPLYKFEKQEAITPKNLSEFSRVYWITVDEEFYHEVNLGTENDLKDTKMSLEAFLNMPLTKDNAYAYAQKELRYLTNEEKIDLKAKLALELI